jgi:hypothetical protein
MSQVYSSSMSLNNYTWFGKRKEEDGNVCKAMWNAEAIIYFAVPGWQSQPTIKSCLICSLWQIINYLEVSAWVISSSPLAAATVACQD